MEFSKKINYKLILFYRLLFAIFEKFYILIVLMLHFSQNIMARPNNEIVNCPIVEISAEIKYQKNSYKISGQGIVFNDIRTKSQTYIIAPAHIVFGSHAVWMSCPGLSKNKSNKIKLTQLGISPTYDLAILKLDQKPESLKLNPLFDFNGSNEVQNLNLPPINEAISNFKKNHTSTFYWIENQRFQSASAGVDPGVWPRSYSILPYDDEITSMNGVRPGMSGSLIYITNNNSYGNHNYLGMVTKTSLNNPASIAIPFNEIMPKLDKLIKKEDLRKNDKKNLPFIDFAFKEETLEDKKILTRVQQLKITSESNITHVYAEDSCPSSQFSPVSNWVPVDPGGGGGGSIIDSGGSIIDGSDSWNNLETQASFTATPVDFINRNGQLKLIRSIFFKERTCSQQGVKWLTVDGEEKNLYGLKLKLNPASPLNTGSKTFSYETILPIHSVTDLLRVDWELNDIKDLYNFYGFVNTYGIFNPTEISNQFHQDHLVNNPLITSLCHKEKKNYPSPPGMIPMVNRYNQLSNTSGFKFFDFESLISYNNSIVRLMEDYKKVFFFDYNKYAQYKDNDFTSRSACNEETDKTFYLKAESEFTDKKDAGYSYTLTFDINNKSLNFKLNTANGKIPNSEKYQSYTFKVSNYKLPNSFWSQFVELEDKSKLEFRYDPSSNSIQFNILVHEEVNSNHILNSNFGDETRSQIQSMPLKMIRLLFNLDTEN